MRIVEAMHEHDWLAAGSQTVQQQALRDFTQAMRNFFTGTHRRPTWRKAGVHEGFRQVAVKPRHSIPRGAAVRIDRSFAPQRRPVFLHYRRQAYYGRLHQAVTALIEEAVRRRLDRRQR